MQEVVLNQVREHVIQMTSPMYRGTIQKAFDGTASPRAAIKAMCLTCTGDSRTDVRDCTSFGCPLREYRPFQVKDDE
jgi:hypothetical protein